MHAKTYFTKSDVVLSEILADQKCIKWWWRIISWWMTVVIIRFTCTTCTDKSFKTYAYTQCKVKLINCQKVLLHITSSIIYFLNTASRDFFYILHLSIRFSLDVMIHVVYLYIMALLELDTHFISSGH